jgi:hypothetical protein
MIRAGYEQAARHRRDRRRSGLPCPVYFTDPVKTPFVSVLWNSTKNRMQGRTPSNADDAVVVASIKFCP